MSDRDPPKRTVLRYEQSWPDLLSRLAADRKTGLAPSRPREVLVDLLDSGSFVELGSIARREPVRYDAEDFDGDAAGMIDGDAQVVGWGTRSGRPVIISADDVERGGPIRGRAAEEKARRVKGLALDQGAPLLSLFESRRAAPGEEPVGAELLDVGLGFDVGWELEASERIPKLAIINGSLDTPATIEALWCHVVVMVSRATVELEGDGPWNADRCFAAGLVDWVVDDLSAAAQLAGRALDLLPVNRWESAVVAVPRAASGRLDPAMSPRAALAGLADADSLFELRGGISPSTVTCLGRVEGLAVGLLTIDPLPTTTRTHPGEMAERDKVVRFGRLCHNLGVPIVAVHADREAPGLSDVDISIALGSGSPLTGSAYALTCGSPEQADRSSDAVVHPEGVRSHVVEVLAGFGNRRLPRRLDEQVNRGRRGNLFRTRRY